MIDMELSREFSPRLVFPMHAKSGDAMYGGFEKTSKSKVPGLSVGIPKKMGERFEYDQGKIEN